MSLPVFLYSLFKLMGILNSIDNINKNSSAFSGWFMSTMLSLILLGKHLGY